MLTKLKLSLVLIMAAAFVAGCGFGGDEVVSSHPAGPPAAPAAQMPGMKMPAEQSMSSETANANEVVIQNFLFQPSTLTVKAGTKVTWINRDDEPHTATDTESRFGSKALDTGDRFTTEFTKPGTYNYYCALHPKMTGKIIVE
jgi:plastocyanin